jgi:glycosyltransferase involved in cell wall biosynthesis
MLSILIPSYNHARYVIEAIDSARRINVPGKHIYVIDDASTDSSAEVITNYLKLTAAPDVTFIRKSVNKGVIDSVLTFLSLCRTEYVYFMASDDVALPVGIKSLVDMLDAKSNLQFVIGGGRNVLESGVETPLYGRKHEILFGLAQPDLIRSLFLVDPSPLLCQSTVFRLRAILEVSGFDPDIAADDYALFAKLIMRYGKRGIDFEFKPQIDCVLYRHHGSNSYLNLLRQAVTHRQVILTIAPTNLRNKGAGYKLSFFVLAALRKFEFSAAVQIARLSERREVPWMFVGLFANIRNWLAHRQ